MANSILIVDDDSGVREIFAMWLRREGYKVFVAATGSEGLKLVSQEMPNLVLLDVNLPDINGMELCKAIKGNPALKDVFVALCSGEAIDPERKIHGLEVGADEYLIKPFGAGELLARARTLLRLRDTTAALRASEEYYRRLVDILPDAICLISPQGRLVSVNSRALMMLGYDSAELMGKTIHDLVPKDDPLQTNLLAMNNRVIRAVECTLLRKDGEYIQVELSAAVASDEGGQTIGLLCAARDITKRKQAEKILRDSEERFRQLADNIREVFWMTNAEKTQMIYVSPAYEQIWGRSTASLYRAPQDWLDAVHPEDRERIAEATLNKQILGKYDEIYRILRPDESIRWIQDRAFPILNDAGKVYRLVGIAEDITEKQKVWDALRESEARKSAIMNVALDGIITIDYAGKIIELNSAAENLFGQGRDRIAGGNIKEFIPTALRKWFADGLSHLFSGEKGPAIGSRIEMPVLRADGSRFKAELTFSRIKLHGEPSFTIFIRDITQRKQAEEELRLLPQRIIKAQEEERSRVARELHDGVNQIIAAVKMRLQNVREGLPTFQAGTREILARCDNLLARCLEENRRISHNLRPADLSNLGFSTACQNLCKEFESHTGLKIQPTIKLPGVDRLPPAVELTLFRIVQEAINNIEKYALAKTVSLEVTCKDKSIFLLIKDDGLGFDAKKPGSKKLRHGLGITNMRERALSVGGSFQILSAPGGGTVVDVRIPFSGQKAESRTEPDMPGS